MGRIAGNRLRIAPLSSLHYIILLTVLSHIAFAGSRVTVSLYAIHLHASPFTIGLLMALYAFLPALLSISVGRLIDRIGVRVPMIVGSLLMVFGTLAPVLLNGINALYFASALIGTGFMVIGVGGYQVVGEQSTAEQRPAHFSLLALGFSVSGFSGPMIAGFAIDHLGHAQSFLMLAAFAFTPAIVLAVNRVRLPRPHGHAERPSESAVMDLLRNSDLRRIYIAVALFSVAWDVYIFAIPVYGYGIGLSASQIGLIMGSFAAATFAIRLAVPFIARNVKPWPLMMASSLVAAASYFLIPLAANALILMALLFLLGLGLGAPQPVVLSLLHETAPPGRGGEAVGVRILLINLSQTVMPLVFGALGAALGIVPVFWLTALCLTAGGWLAHKRAFVDHKPMS